MATLNSESPVPLYYQLRKFITERIDSGEWKPGDRLPSESELGLQFKISRTTVRQALGELTVQGMLTRIQGKGTFVAPARIQKSLTLLTGFNQDMRSRGLRASSHVLNLELAMAKGRAVESLGVKPEEEVVLLRQLHLADDEPMAVETAYLLSSFYESLSRENLAEQSLYEILRGRCEVIPTRASQQMEAIACPAYEARLLQVRKGSPVLHIHRTSYDQNGLPFEQVESFYRGDRYIFYTELST